MKRRKVWETLVIALALVGAFTLSAKATDTLEAISAYLNYGITIKHEGIPQTMMDANGVRVYPITYNGTTYVPIRAVSNMLGVGVEWDQATQSVLLGDPEEGVDLIDTYKAYALSYATQTQSSDGKTGSIGGVAVNHWIDFHATASGHPERSAHFNLGGKYSSITFQAYSQLDATLTVYGDDNCVLAEIPLTGAAAPKSHTVPLQNTTELFFHITMTQRPNFTETSNYVFDAKLS